MGGSVFEAQCFSVEDEDNIFTQSHAVIMKNVMEGEKPEK